MPFYEYKLVAELEQQPSAGCPDCRPTLTVLQKINDPVLTQCPHCQDAIRRMISPPHVVSGKAHQLKQSSIEKAGFTQYKKIGNGMYEKTAGKGPSILSSDD